MPALDIDVLYAHLKPHDWLKEGATRVLTRVREGGLRAYASAHAIVELEIIGRRDFGPEFANQVLQRVGRIEQLRLIAVDRVVLRRAMQLRRRHELGIFDGLHAATALLQDRQIISTDVSFDRVPRLVRLDPREF
jgi:predicted nucleic acid-binding protein